MVLVEPVGPLLIAESPFDGDDRFPSRQFPLEVDCPLALAVFGEVVPVPGTLGRLGAVLAAGA